jgi:tRNA(Ile)-lysidine synthase
LIERILSFIKSNQLINPNEIIIAAVSGGVDSVVMLHCLNEIKEHLQFKLEIVHVNHGIRGSESDKDEALVKETAEELHLPFFSERLTGFDLNTSEDDLRAARYAVFDDLIRKRPSVKVATAHTLDDQLETFLMRFAKGSKLNGLCSIPVSRDYYIRPVLFLKKSELESYALKNNIQFREDATNRGNVKTRNKIRHNLIPDFVEIFGENFYDGFQASFNDLNNVNNYLKKQVDLITQDICQKQDDALQLDTNGYLSQELKIRHLILESCVSGHYPLNFGIPSGYFFEFESFVKKASTGSVFLFRNNLKVIKLRKNLLFTTGENRSQQKLELYPGDVVYTGNYEIRVDELKQNKPGFTKDGKIEFVCGDRIKWPLTVRNWIEGDWFVPLGSNHHQKLSDFFINQKIEVNEKSEIPIVTDEDNIVWIAGLRIDDRYKVKADCKKIYKLELRLKAES